MKNIILYTVNAKAVAHYTQSFSAQFPDMQVKAFVKHNEHTQPGQEAENERQLALFEQSLSPEPYFVAIDDGILGIQEDLIYLDKIDAILKKNNYHGPIVKFYSLGDHCLIQENKFAAAVAYADEDECVEQHDNYQEIADQYGYNVVIARLNNKLATKPLAELKPAITQDAAKNRDDGLSAAEREEAKRKEIELELLQYLEQLRYGKCCR